jgi:hypothetical protein
LRPPTRSRQMRWRSGRCTTCFMYSQAFRSGGQVSKVLHAFSGAHQTIPRVRWGVNAGELRSTVPFGSTVWPCTAALMYRMSCSVICGFVEHGSFPAGGAPAHFNAPFGAQPKKCMPSVPISNPRNNKGGILLIESQSAAASNAHLAAQARAGEEAAGAVGVALVCPTKDPPPQSLAKFPGGREGTGEDSACIFLIETQSVPPTNTATLQPGRPQSDPSGLSGQQYSPDPLLPYLLRKPSVESKGHIRRSQGGVIGGDLQLRA